MKTKCFKLKKKEYWDLSALLYRTGLVESSDHGECASPERLYVSPRTYRMIEKAVRAQFKKTYPGISKNKLHSAVGMELLNLGPSTSEAIKDGYAVAVY
jgi:hypothetical protein